MHEANPRQAPPAPPACHHRRPRIPPPKQAQRAGGTASDASSAGERGQAGWEALASGRGTSRRAALGRRYWQYAVWRAVVSQRKRSVPGLIRFGGKRPNYSMAKNIPIGRAGGSWRPLTGSRVRNAARRRTLLRRNHSDRRSTVKNSLLCPALPGPPTWRASCSYISPIPSGPSPADRLRPSRLGLRALSASKHSTALSRIRTPGFPHEDGSPPSYQPACPPTAPLVTTSQRISGPRA
jgi:hypothetical protein